MYNSIYLHTCYMLHTPTECMYSVTVRSKLFFSRDKCIDIEVGIYTSQLKHKMLSPSSCPGGV